MIKKQLKMLAKTITLAVFLTASGCVPYVAPNSWTLREDCHLRASQRNEDYTIEQWIAKTQKEEGQAFGIVLSPAGAKAVSDEIKTCHIDLESCRAGN